MKELMISVLKTWIQNFDFTDSIPIENPRQYIKMNVVVVFIFLWQ